MKARTFRVILVLPGVLLAGCESERAGSPQLQAGTQGDLPASRQRQWTETQEFRWGDAALRPGMTKNQVLEQIAKSGLRDFNGQFGIRPPPPEMLQKDVWRLSCGTSTGAAPGFAAVRLTFHEGKLTKIEAYIGPMAA